MYNKTISIFFIDGDMAELVDATDLKFVDLFDREGSSPSIPKNC